MSIIVTWAPFELIRNQVIASEIYRHLVNEIV